MRDWNSRSKEVAYLLNPAFCGRILYNTIKTYSNITHRAFPFPLIYLILPLVLHKRTRNLINSRTQMLIWLQRYPETLIDFPKRARELVLITNEAIELLLHAGLLQLTNNGELEIVKTVKSLSKTKYTNDEIKDCIKKSEHIAKWFAAAGKVETIFISLGVRP
ncbi:TPA: hypothetical protein N2D04_003838 [Clostridium botulinum]|nr:hypothetical protein [Clostridium botulinum]HCL4448475.1 hypothetical protein [Clostridium botulinum]HCL4458724.1 hypothetical protein [Clostridium botulinum]HCL4459633.1 hypothetical protein [Clostridium botulinum]HCL4462636.1 hypothetical protein [Clostridium botulinum]